MLFASRSRRLGKLPLRNFTIRGTGLFTLLLAMCVPTIGCIKKSPALDPGGTPAGTYTYTITATSGAISHTVSVTLFVQPG